jgi:hypothetical protein
MFLLQQILKMDRETSREKNLCEISGSHGGEFEAGRFLGYSAV